MTTKNTIVKHASEFYAEYDDHGNISELSKQKFDENGFLTFPPGFIDEKLLDNFLLEANKNLIDWNDGEIDLNSDFSKVKFRFVNSYTENNVKYWGCPLQHRITRGFGSVFPEENKNWLLGKRATIPTRSWNKKMASIVENTKMQSVGKFLLNANELSFHNGSVARTYPGTEGESKSFHVDPSGFTRNPLSAIKNNRYVVNIFTYLSDVTEQLAPIRFVPGSHNEYLRINEYICKKNNISSEINMMDKTQPLYEEILPDFLAEPIKIVGDKGTTIAFHYGLLHATTANKSESEDRTVLICNYANRNHKEFFQNYQKANKKFASYINEKELIENTFLGKGQQLFLRNLKRSMLGINSKIYSKIRAKKSIVLQLKNYIQYSSIPLEHRRYLNVGAGSNWQHPLFVSTDQALGVSMKMDLSKRIPLPFNNNQFINIYSSHFFEHLKYFQSQYLLKEIYRCLDVGGVFRIVVPDIGKWLDAYEQKNSTFFIYSSTGEIYPQDSWLRLIVRQFAEPVVDRYSDEELYDIYNNLDREDFLNYFESQCNEENDERLAIPDVHKAWYSEKRMKSLLLASGFQRVVRVKPTESSSKFFTDNYKRFDGVKPGRNASSLFMEATKE
jgi:predicted SAM-dependent methyltransferase